MGEYDVVLLPTFTQVEDWRKRHARECESGLFSQGVTTFNAWVAELWELFGDGRSIVDSLQRQVIMQAAFEQMADEDGVLRSFPHGFDVGVEGSSETDGGCLTASSGVVKLAARCVREASGLPAFERALDEARLLKCPAGLDSREMALLQGIDCYRELLFSASLVEVGQAAAYLARHNSDVFPQAVRVLVAHAAPLDWHMRHFFDACENLEVVVEQAAGAGGVGRVPNGVGLRFGFPAGRYAQGPLVADLVRERLARWSSDARGAGCTSGEAAVVVACKDPLALYKDLEGELARDGAALAVQAMLPFSLTDFGQRFLQLCRAIDGESWSICDLSDAVRPPFSGFSNSDARAIDTRLRADRIADRDEVLSTLRAASDTFSQLEEIAGDPEADILLGVFDQIAFSAPGRSAAWRAEQLGAVSALRACTSAAREVGASMKACTRVLEDVVVTVSLEACVGEDAAGDARLAAEPAGCGSPESAEATARPRVLVTTQDVAAQMGEGSCDVLVLCDLTSDDYPVADRDDAARTLFGKLGLLPVDSALARTRRSLFTLQHLPTTECVFVRPLNDRDGNPTYPCALLQELIDAYRADATDDADLDEVFGLPPALLEGALQRGEELLYANATAREARLTQPISSVDTLHDLGEIAPGDRVKVALSRRTESGLAYVGFAPSPSQVETYLDCPYKWFAQSRLKLESLDEGFGPLQRGSFAHAVLQEFYRRFRAEGYAKVASDNKGRARELMREVASEQERLQREMEPGTNRYVAVGQMERRELESVKERLVSYLDFEAEFLPTFRPMYLEYAITADAGVEYAGHPFVGIVDRIDVDDAGRAVIIDYKGSAGAAYAVAGKTADEVGKVQALMYAQAVRRVLGLNVVGALYVSYGKTHGCAGAVDALAIDAAHLADANPERSRCAAESSAEALAEGDFAQMAFSDVLDSVEDIVAQAMASMEAGYVDPNPSTPDSCTYCPCAFCAKRGV